jgi:hypothetical protein
MILGALLGLCMGGCPLYTTNIVWSGVWSGVDRDRNRGEERGDPNRTKGANNHNICLVFYAGLSRV